MFWTVLASRNNFSQKVGTLKIRLKKKSNPNSKNEIPCASAKEGNRGSDLVKDVLSQHQNSGLSHENRSKMYQNHPKSLWDYNKSAHWMISDFPSAVDVLPTPMELRNRQFWKATLFWSSPRQSYSFTSNPIVKAHLLSNRDSCYRLSPRHREFNFWSSNLIFFLNKTSECLLHGNKYKRCLKRSKTRGFW